MIFACPKPPKKNICEAPGCNKKSKMKYRGYYTYKFCPEHYFEWYEAFCEWIHKLNHGRCVECGRKAEVVHHETFRSQGGRHLPENCVSMCIKCHNPIHGQ